MSKHTKELRKEFQNDTSSIQTYAQLESLTIKYLGRNGKINKIFTQISTISPDEKKSFGAEVNALKQEVEKSLEDLKITLRTKREASEYVDPTIPGKAFPKGSLHLITYAVEEISRIIHYFPVEIYT